MSRIVENGVEWMAGLSFPICNGCAHHLGGDRCAAFSARIPEAILDGKHDHHEPYPGDHGMRFEAVKDPTSA